MSLFEMCRELSDVQPHLLTQKEYAVLVKAAAKKLIPGYIAQRNQARLELQAWERANPQPNRPSRSYYSVAEEERWMVKYNSYRNAWGDEYQKWYELASAITQFKLNIILANLILDGRITSCQNNEAFWSYFQGVNNPLMNHGQAVFTALRQGLEVPEHVLAEWPEGVEAVRKDMASQAAWEKSVAGKTRL